MTSPQWPRIKALFEQALDIPIDEIPAWLNREAADNDDVRREVVSLLEHHRSAGTFLDVPPALTEDDEAPALQPGQTLGAYSIIREIGQGGMGRVYMARDERLNRTVALKAVRRPADADQAARLRSEAQAAARLAHQGVCTIFALEELDGRLFIASEFVEGQTLREELATRTPPSASEVLQTAREIADALASAHEAGIAHGDLKPENVMRARNGRLKILDFGLARRAAFDNEPESMPMAGTPGYMPGEQLAGGPIDIRGDVFAFGVLLYEYASGRHPFGDGTAFERAARVLEGNPRPLREVRQDLPPIIYRIVERSTKKAAADRFSSAGQIVEALSAGDDATPRTRVAGWWRAHHIIVILLYLAAAVAAWRTKQTGGRVGTALFLLVGIAGTVAGVFRGHLLFTERVNSSRLTAELQRAAPFTLAMDLLIAVCLCLDAAMLAGVVPVQAVLAASLGIGLALVRIVVEPSTTSAAFDNAG